MDLIFEQIRTGGDRNFAYLLGDPKAKAAVIVDPSYNPQAVVSRAKAQNLTVEYIINTHGHPDHVNGNSIALEKTPARLAAFAEAHTKPSLALSDNQSFDVGSLRFEVLHVPGHCDDHILLFLPEYEVALTGDLLFVGKVGGTNSESAARTEWQSLQRVLSELPRSTTIWPGHDYGARPSSTLALEQRTNPFLLCSTFDEFLNLKNTWADFKLQNGLV